MDQVFSYKLYCDDKTHRLFTGSKESLYKPVEINHILREGHHPIGKFNKVPYLLILKDNAIIRLYENLKDVTSLNDILIKEKLYDYILR